MNEVWVKESPIALVAGEQPAYTVTVDGGTTITGPSVKIYKNLQDVTATNIPSGSASASGNIITLPTITALVGGSVYVVEVTGTFDGVVSIRKFMLIVQKNGEEQ